MPASSKDVWASALEDLTESDRQQLAFYDGQDRLGVLSDLQMLTESAKERCIKKRWRFNRRSRNGETIVLRDVFNKMVVWINMFKQNGDTVVQYDPGHAALPWAGVCFILQIAVGGIGKFDFVVKGAESIARMIGRYAIYEDIYLRHTSKALVELDDVLRFKTASDSLEPFSIGQYENSTGLMELLRTTDEPILRMSSRLSGIEDHLDKSERYRILRWVSEQPYLEHHEQISKNALAGTGKWLLEDPTYAQWHNGSTSSLLWLHGKVGAGKSTLVSIVIEDAVRRFEAGQNPQPVCFYCSRNAAEPQWSDPAAILSSIARQLLCAEPGLPLLPLVIEKYEKKDQGFSSQGLRIEESCQLITKLIENYPMTTIFIDALDECNPEKRDLLLDAIESLLQDSSLGL
ncbi:MAG: hypothetical protein Q9175_000641 [Cornicularia normoerica]